MPTFKPLGARILVKDIITTLSLEKRAELSGLSIVLEEDHRPRPTQGRVIALGDDPILHDDPGCEPVYDFEIIQATNQRIKVLVKEGRPPRRSDIHIGDIVFFGHHAGTENTIQDEVYRMLEWQEITAVQSEETKPAEIFYRPENSFEDGNEGQPRKLRAGPPSFTTSETPSTTQAVDTLQESPAPSGGKQ